MNLYIWPCWPLEPKILETKYCRKCQHPVWLHLTLFSLRCMLSTGLIPIQCTDCRTPTIFRMKVALPKWKEAKRVP